MTDTTHDHQDGCLMCAVRALTEGDPATTWGQNEMEPGTSISGVVLRQGKKAMTFGKVPYVDLWTGGTGRVRVMPFGSTFAHALAGAAARIGDRLQVWYDGTGVLESGVMRGRTFKKFTINVQRGH